MLRWEAGVGAQGGEKWFCTSACCHQGHIIDTIYGIFTSAGRGKTPRVPEKGFPAPGRGMGRRLFEDPAVLKGGPVVSGARATAGRGSGAVWVTVAPPHAEFGNCSHRVSAEA